MAERLAALWRASAPLRATLRRPEIMAFLPAATLAAFWFGGEQALVVTALATPLLFALAGAFRVTPDPDAAGADVGLTSVQMLTRVVADQMDDGGTGVLVVLLDDAQELYTRHGPSATAEIHDRIADRLLSALRQGDRVARLGEGAFGVALAPLTRMDIETMVQIAARLQATVAPPISLDATRLYVTASIGFCLAGRAPDPGAAGLIAAAQAAAEDARRQGPGAIRAWTPEATTRASVRGSLRDALDTAFAEGQIRPHFQPQVSTDTGALSGFEALARWHHPERGLMPPAEFLPAVAEAGLSGRLAEAIVAASLKALHAWDQAGLHVPRVAVNFSSAELRDPRLVDKLQWELDRFDLKPDRLACEVMESVAAATEDDIIVRNLAALARAGCLIELDDFGTGHAALANVRRFSVARVKIDRSFVTRLAQDRDQQRCVAAILSMAEQLGLDTLAEGVETAEDHAMLAQLGCRHIQGFIIARPMTFDDTLAWIPQHRARLRPLPRIATRQG
jgi:EAL domain-containing protein (putative c-di-GMP-specific phosphodiesterase class I)/GGDEF domain-containing protein